MGQAAATEPRDMGTTDTRVVPGPKAARIAARPAMAPARSGRISAQPDFHCVPWHEGTDGLRKREARDRCPPESASRPEEAQEPEGTAVIKE